LIDPAYSNISVKRQCELVGLGQSSYYYKPATTDSSTLTLLNLIDEEYTRHPFIGTRKMMHYLRSLGHGVNRKRVQRLYRQLGIEAVYCKPNTSAPNASHKIYPYLLRGLPIVKPNQVYCADITYIRLNKGFMYLFAIMDWYSRYVLGWTLSPSLEADSSVELLQDVLDKRRCEIFNTDQGSQFTSIEFTKVLLDKDIQVSMDGRGRALDNVFIERLWRSVKYECIYLRDFDTVSSLRAALEEYLDYYNNMRLHQSLSYKVPREIHCGG
jgi:putative transposase